MKRNTGLPKVPLSIEARITFFESLLKDFVLSLNPLNDCIDAARQVRKEREEGCHVEFKKRSEDTPIIKPL